MDIGSMPVTAPSGDAPRIRRTIEGISALPSPGGLSRGPLRFRGVVLGRLECGPESAAGGGRVFAVGREGFTPIRRRRLGRPPL